MSYEEMTPYWFGVGRPKIKTDYKLYEAQAKQALISAMLYIKNRIQRLRRGYRTVSDRTAVTAWDMVCPNFFEL